MDTLMGEEGDLVVNPEGDGEPVKSMQDGFDVFKFLHSHQDPSSAALDVLELLETLAGNPAEKCVALVQPAGEKGQTE